MQEIPFNVNPWKNNEYRRIENNLVGQNTR